MGATGKMIGLAVAAIVAGSILPTAVVTWYAAGTGANWGATNITLWQTLGPLLIIVAVVMGFFAYAKLR